jgi:FtsH-binding integral membrane protein
MLRAAICSRVSPAIVLYCAILTTVMVIGLTIYAFVTEIDYTKLLPYLFMACLLLLTASIVNIFLRLPALRMIIAAVGVFLFSVYLIVDTQLVIGKNSQLLELDDYILGALLIYLDIIQIFLQLLQLMGSRN